MIILGTECWHRLPSRCLKGCCSKAWLGKQQHSPGPSLPGPLGTPRAPARAGRGRQGSAGSKGRRGSGCGKGSRGVRWVPVPAAVPAGRTLGAWLGAACRRFCRGMPGVQALPGWLCSGPFALETGVHQLGCTGCFPAASWDAANGKLFPIPSEAQMAGKAEQEGIKRPLFPLCSCWEREGGVLAVTHRGFVRPGCEHLSLQGVVQAAPVGSLTAHPCPGSWGSAWGAIPGHCWVWPQVVVKTCYFEWVGDLGLWCALALPGCAAGDASPTGASLGCVRGSAHGGSRQGYAHTLTAAVSLVPLELGTAPGQLSVAQRQAGRLWEGPHSTPHLRGCLWPPCSQRDAVFMDKE